MLVSAHRDRGPPSRQDLTGIQQELKAARTRRKLDCPELHAESVTDRHSLLEDRIPPFFPYSEIGRAHV